jgi:hypothetical protein
MYTDVSLLSSLQENGALDELQRFNTRKLVQASIAKAAEAPSGDIAAATRETETALEAFSAKRAKLDMADAARAAGTGAGFSFAVRRHMQHDHGTDRSSLFDM